MPRKKLSVESSSNGEEKGNGSVLIITEKPQAAMKIAAALSDGRDRKHGEKGVNYYEFERGGKKIIVGCAVGHLFGIGQKPTEKGAKKKQPLPNFDVDWRPNYESKGASYTKRYLDMLKKISKDVSEVIVATDYDVEGEVIGWNVVRFICKRKDASRMKFSSLTKDELNYAYENLSKTINWGQAIAGETRHYLDWFYGINLSRALMKALSSTGKFRIISIGRVQGPALQIIVDRELEIKNFKSEPYWQVFMLIQDLNNQKLEVQYVKDIFDEKELMKFRTLKGKKAFARTDIKEEKLNAPTPFDLTTLQTEAYKFCGLTPTQTLQIAQQLYLDGLISYPRTSSQKYPEAIGYDKILKSLTKQTQLTKYAVNKKPTEGKKTDPAHPAVYPTGEKSEKLEGQAKKLYELIVKRFISCFCLPAILETKKVHVEVDGLKFLAEGLQIKEKNWLNVYPSRIKEVQMPTINGEVDIKELRIEEKQTQPPKRYSEASLVKELEKRNLGTKATRASIVQTLYDRGYIKERSIEATSLGIKLIDTLRKYSPIIIDEKLTREVEEEMDNIIGADKDLEKKEEKIINLAKKNITVIIEDMKKNETKIGADILEGSQELRQAEIKDNTLTKCPKCQKGNLRISFNRLWKRYFISCDAYPECKTTFSLPPNRLIKPSKDKDDNLELCVECKFPLLLAITRGKRPWKLCFNPECPSRKRADEEKKEWLAKNPEKAQQIQEKKDSEQEKFEKTLEKKKAKNKVAEEKK